MSIGERLRAARKKAGFPSASAAAKAFGWAASTYASHENGQTETPPIEAIERYAKAFRASADEIAFGYGKTAKPAVDPNAVMPVQMVAVRGKVQAGQWNEFEDFDVSQLEPVPTVPGRWFNFEQFAFKVAGPSVDKAGILDGDFVICVPYFIARATLTDKDMVVVERRRGPTVERTVKRLRVLADESQLWPESTDPRFQEPIRVKRNGHLHEDDGTTVEIIGLVIGRWAPIG